MVPLPDYACAVIEDARGWLLLQLRPADARIAPDQLTCFGGRREEGEDDRVCLQRELSEELGWSPAVGRPCCELWRGERFIARFYRCSWGVGSPRTESGHLALWAPWPALAGLALSPWHAAVLAAVRAGDGRVSLAITGHPP